MDVLERASRLHHEAGDLLQTTPLGQALSQLGEITFTGSFFLDLMVYPDLDLYLPTVPVERIFTVATRVAEDSRLVRLSYENEPHPGMEGGLYLNVRFAIGDWGRPWKVDIWWLEPEMILEKMEPMLRFQKMLTPELRQAILEYKFSLLNEIGRTPQYSGYYIYKAFLDEGLRDPEDVTRYLVSKGIQVD